MRNLPILVLCVLMLAGPAAAAQQETADIIYHGDILTMLQADPGADAEAPDMAEALAIKDGKVLAVGPRLAIDAAHKGDATRVVELGGRAIVPGFVDPHSHFINALAMKEWINVSAPPVGPASTPEQIVAELQEATKDRNSAPGDLVIGYGYDDGTMPPGSPLTRDVLDAAFPDNPVIVLHVSLHGGVLNSPALTKYGISAATETPAGGVIVRKPGSNEPAGLVMETAFLPIFAALPTPSPDQELDRLAFAQQTYAAAGITTATEGATRLDQLELLQRGAARDALYLDVVALPLITDLDKVLARNPATSFGKYDHRLKLGGCKIITDGSPQAKTAYFTTPYRTGGPDGEQSWRGEPTVPQDVLNAMVKKCYDEGLQVFLHANGDAAIDMALKAHEYAAAGDLSADRRTTIVHSQFVRKDQLKKYADYNIIPSFYTEHVFFFSATHAKNRGNAETAFISPLQTAQSFGLMPTNHTDFNVAPIDQMFVLWTAMNRVSREGEFVGDEERVSVLDALATITINAARQYREDDTKGSLRPGKLADLVILDKNPLYVSPSTIKDVRVLETIKEGKTIYKAPPATPQSI